MTIENWRMIERVLNTSWKQDKKTRKNKYEMEVPGV